ncbi:glycine cleavage system protein GcvH [Rhodospirillum rubrum]|uniref:Glycine cleavage system H protein n=1 Tax=Rhodospirillum rubrum (strain ATCC 11170 / ATH 1.1.1 / DSM 467 / LMG 4362 / NCIMB 8255 / S1) TaxID=269796 RepID=GCSH_RHORT|nr:glycine cleavage system protein GcvH [Rhodospirillum rubrum]Q2RPV0.1 RecName: Full=Glycine cleavage system H protein [Rhodospirillum rubrum ATCC 11170]ABC23845.1 Glycine cleavage H-protein [Rhodospirillum rubrum ATCC 11170]AEO49587.1 glycine cleavage system protein H [Rhodospirillum rubrum F11]MBK5955522.1 glycine cleavage system protein H [Rhodospirillum rubrum]QXG79793.1 glycine cleavage system protein GcvH [Rhodospirillum rubrum]HAP98870.1 glycine cleavage system protein H [Rhodospirill
MSKLYFTEDHEWVSVDDDGIGTIGITDYAQKQLGDVVFVELPEIGREIERGGDAAVVESVKAASEVYSPVSGEVVEANDSLPEAPGQVNTDALGDGWFFKVRLSEPAELDELMDQEAYDAFVGELD